MKVKKVMPFSRQILLSKVLGGSALALAGLLGLLDQPILGLVDPILLQIAALFLSVYLTIKVSGAKKEASDEMAEENLNRAKARTLDLIYYVFLLLILLSRFLPQGELPSLDWLRTLQGVCFIFIGVQELLVGLIFIRLERA